MLQHGANRRRKAEPAYIPKYYRWPGKLSFPDPCNYRPTPSQRRIREGGRHFRLTSVLSTLPTPTSCLVGLAARLVCTLHVSLPSGAYSTQKRQPVDGQGISSIIIGYLISLSPPPHCLPAPTSTFGLFLRSHHPCQRAVTYLM